MKPRFTTSVRGVTLFELAVALALLVVFVGSAAHVVTTLAVGQRTAERRAYAQRALDNLQEEFSAAGFRRLQELIDEDAAPEDLAAQLLPDSVRESLPGARLTCQVNEEAEPVSARRVTLSLTWTNLHGQPSRPVRLTAWIFPSEQTTE